MSDEWSRGLVGMTEVAATADAMGEGYTVRVTKRDGQAFVVTRDFRTDRVNLDVESGVIVAARVG